MTTPTTAAITDALSQLIDPNTGKDFVSSKALKKLSVEGGQVNLEVSLGYPAQTQLASLRSLITNAVQTAVGTTAGVQSVTIDLDWKMSFRDFYLKLVSVGDREAI